MQRDSNSAPLAHEARACPLRYQVVDFRRLFVIHIHHKVVCLHISNPFKKQTNSSDGIKGVLFGQTQLVLLKKLKK